MATGAYIFGPEGPDISPDESAFFREADPFGFIVFARNCISPDQLARLTGDLRDTVGRAAPVLIDQEGGRVQRMRAPHWREWLPPLEQVQGSASARGMYLRGLLIGAELVRVGIDVNCAPSGDIAFDDTHPFLRNRCYGTEAATVTDMARAVAEGLMDAGCLPVIKHAPGHGRATLDSHKDLPRIDADLDTLTAEDFAPFRALSDLPMVMTAHLVIPAIDPEVPVTLSRDGIAYLRDHLGLGGLLMTDDISMGALDGTLAERCARALGAGCDLVLHCNGVLSEMTEVAAASGAMTGTSEARANAALAQRRAAVAFDENAAQEELAELLQGEVHA